MMTMKFVRFMFLIHRGIVPFGSGILPAMLLPTLMPLLLSSFGQSSSSDSPRAARTIVAISATAPAVIVVHVVPTDFHGLPINKIVDGVFVSLEVDFCVFGDWCFPRAASPSPRSHISETHLRRWDDTSILCRSSDDARWFGRSEIGPSGSRRGPHWPGAPSRRFSRPRSERARRNVCGPAAFGAWHRTPRRNDHNRWHSRSWHSSFRCSADSDVFLCDRSRGCRHPDCCSGQLDESYRENSFR